MIIPNIWENKKNVPNHQPVIDASKGTILKQIADATRDLRDSAAWTI